MKNITYEYDNFPIPGGGYVTGLLYHEKQKNILYARTDIGGTYRFDFDKQRWINLTSHVTMMDLSETFVISIALNDTKPGKIYVACGNDKPKSGLLAISDDLGETFRYEKIPCYVHGNFNGRGTGERLICDNEDENTLFFASQTEGLWVTHNEGKKWEKINAIPEQAMTFIRFVGKALIVGTAGVTTGDEHSRGKSLYISYDRGQTFEVMDAPVGVYVEDSQWNGLVAQRCAVDDKYLYITFASTGRRGYTAKYGYSCDCGDVINGHVVRYEIKPDGTIGNYENITPTMNFESRETQYVDFGFSGISVSRQTPGLVICSTMVKDYDDSVYRSYDYGNTWEEILCGLNVGKMTFRTPYMKPEYNGNGNLIHWLSDIKINPFDDNEAWFNTGTGVFRTTTLKNNTVEFMDWCDGIEETVHLNVYALPKGEVKVIDIVGDLGGFAFTEFDKPCENSFADKNGNRYITCMNADFSEEDPYTFIVTPRGNWKRKTKGGLIITYDQGKNFERLPMPFGISEEIDEALKLIEEPNINSGWVSMSMDCKNICWSIAKDTELPVSRFVVSNDGGRTFYKPTIYNLDGNVVTQGHIKTFSDRVLSNVFYGLGECSQFYVSKDCGKTFKEYKLNFAYPMVRNVGIDREGWSFFPLMDFGFIDSRDNTEIRVEAGKSGVIYIALAKCGLWKLVFDIETDNYELFKLSCDNEVVYRVGLGIGSKDGDYYKENKAIYINGFIEGEYGFFRSTDDCVTFERINNDNQMYGEIHSIDGDCREFGVFYLATGSNGIKYGKEVKEV